MKSIIGRVVYKPYEKQKQNVDIYGEPIEFSNLVSYRHRPIQVDEDVKGYEQKYLFPTSRDVVEEMVQQESIPEAKFIIGKTPMSTKHSSNEDAWNKAWTEYGDTLGLKDNKAYLYLLGQIKHESGDFQHMEEIASGDAYEGRRDLGNTQRGDGRKYKGRGPIQVTGRSNYENVYKNFFVPNGLGEYDIVNNPELANDPYIGSLLSIGWLASTDNGKRAISESNNYNIEALTRAINGGYNGLEDRIRRTNELLKQYS